MLKKLLYTVLFVSFSYCGLNFITPHNDFLRKRSIKAQINALYWDIDGGHDLYLKEQYPEGYIFCHALFAMSVIEYSNYAKSIPCFYGTMIDNSVRKLVEVGHDKFDKNLPLENGAFYNGWVNLVLKKYLYGRAFILSDIQQDVMDWHHEFNYKIIEAYQKEKKPLETYTESVWPSDNLVCLASLPQSCTREDIRRYIYGSDKLLLPHSYFDRSIIRGSSTALNTYLESLINLEQSKNINEHLQEKFVDNIIGVRLVKEFEKDIDCNKEADIDSGPLIFGYGSAGSVMNIKTQARLKSKGSKFTWGFMNMLGLPFNRKLRKYYLFKKEMMFDLFMLWSCIEIHNIYQPPLECRIK